MAIKAVSKYNTIAEQDTTTGEDQKIKADKNNRRKELHFKATHALLICFLLWIVYVHFHT